MSVLIQENKGRRKIINARNNKILPVAVFRLDLIILLVLQQTHFNVRRRVVGESLNK